MDEKTLHKLMEIQYLKGRLDELHKAFPTVLDQSRSRKLDVRINKYYNKLKEVDEISYHLYQVERANVRFSKIKSKKEITELLTEVRNRLFYSDDKATLKLVKKIDTQLNKYE